MNLSHYYRNRRRRRRKRGRKRGKRRWLMALCRKTIGEEITKCYSHGRIQYFPLTKCFFLTFQVIYHRVYFRAKHYSLILFQRIIHHDMWKWYETQILVSVVLLGHMLVLEQGHTLYLCAKAVSTKQGQAVVMTKTTQPLRPTRFLSVLLQEMFTNLTYCKLTEFRTLMFLVLIS